jgi:hypothetical protein
MLHNNDATVKNAGFKGQYICSSWYCHHCHSIKSSKTKYTNLLQSLWVLLKFTTSVNALFTNYRIEAFQVVLFFLDLLSAVEPRVVNWSLVTKGEKGLSLIFNNFLI